MANLNSIPPCEGDELWKVSVDPSAVQGFWEANYVRRFIPLGGSKVKWIMGREGSGKTHALRQLAMMCRRANFLVAEVDAGTVPIRGMQEFCRAVLAQLNWEPIFAALSRDVIRHLGYDYEAVPPDRLFLSWLVEERGRVRERGVREIREAVEQVIGSIDLLPNLKTAIGLGLDERLGVHHAEMEILSAWFRGELLPKRQLAVLGLTQSLNRWNGRAILQGWGGLTMKAGLGGILICLDRLEQMLAPKEDGKPYYTRGRRDEFYEMLRQFIDDGDALRGIWIVIAARPELFQDVKKGVKTYPALDARISQEIQSVDINRFADCLDWDRLFQMDRDAQSELARKWAQTLGVPLLANPVRESGMVSPVRRTVEELRSRLGEGG